MENPLLSIRKINRRSQRFTRWVFVTLLIFFCGVFSTQGETDSQIDLLKMPSEKLPKVTRSFLMDVVNADGRIIAVGERGHIIYSDNDCEGWNQAEVPVSVTLTAVYFPTPKKGWAVGHDSVILHSKDGGKTWEKQVDGWMINKLMLAKTEAMVKNKEAELKKAEAAGDEDLIETLTWELDDMAYLVSDTEFVMEEGASRPLFDVWFKNDREGIAIGSFGVILRTSDGGESWEPIIDRIENPFSNHLYAIAQSGNTLYMVGESNEEFGLLFRSDDFGETWTSIESPYEGTYFGIIANPNSNMVIVFGIGGKAFYSYDRGESWAESRSEEETNIIGGTILSDGTVYLSSFDGSLLASIDDGKTFMNFPTKIPPSPAMVEARNGALVLVGAIGAIPIPEDELVSKNKG